MTEKRLPGWVELVIGAATWTGVLLVCRLVVWLMDRFLGRFGQN